MGRVRSDMQLSASVTTSCDISWSPDFSRTSEMYSYTFATVCGMGIIPLPPCGPLGHSRTSAGKASPTR